MTDHPSYLTDLTSRPKPSMRRWLSLHALALTLTLAVVPQANAQQLPELELALKTETFIEPPAYVQQVTAKGMSMLEVSQGARKLVLAHPENKPQIMLLPLTNKGDVPADAKATGFSLPGNEGNKLVNRVLAIATHPTMPVLYVWQDTGTTPDGFAAPKSEKAKKYNHLLIYDISKDQPELLMSTCSGTDFVYGRSTGMLTLGNHGRRLFVPNMRYDVPRSYGVAIGYYTLDDNGLPILTGADPEADPASVSGSSGQEETAQGAGEDDAGDNTPAPAQAQEANEKVTTGRGGGLTMLHLSQIGSRYQAGRAIYIDDAHTLLRSGVYLATYDTSNRTGRLAAVHLPYANTRHSRIVAHDALTMLYANYVGSSHLTAWAIFNGYPSLRPQHVNVAPYGVFASVVQVNKHQKLALGSNYRVLLLSIDERGWIKPTIEQFKVDAGRVSTITYSPKFDRLYVGTDAKLEVNP